MRRIIFNSLALLLPIVLISACGEKKENSLADKNAPVDSLTFELIAEDSTTVFDLTVANGMVEYDKTGQGYFVASIKGVDQFDGYFWIYAVNDTMGMVASNLRKIGPGDRVSWYFRQIIP
jgi:hypothetical protein